MRKKETKKVKVKQLRKEVQEKLAVALADFKNGMPEEKYSKIVKKASKLVVVNFARTNGKLKQKEDKVKAKQVQEPVGEA